MTALEQLRALYFNVTRASIGEDFDTAIDLFKQLTNEEDRERAAVFMDGMAEMRREWAGDAKGGKRKKPEAGNRQQATGNREPATGNRAGGTGTSTRPKRR
jgi:hypothetical protein